ncbi:MAG: hypothetical protein CVV44_11950 [Spirochaetae bacterium HGW-Spirochaetae-1]|jgi:hypothetical protein|nr:MAG: hypothetical protein CVV44_11950 [Spirochaetae bacterium HGW-Spirochaetae-1]
MKNIAIITDWNPGLGSGHIQRMAALADFLNKNDICRARIITARALPFTDTSFFPWIAEKIPGNTDLIIRDMRDSTGKEIEALQASAPVLVIDDNGAGRQQADFAIDLLPNPDIQPGSSAYHPESFIYGHSFSSSIAALGNRVFQKDIDLAIYPGAGAPPEHLEYLIRLVPEGATAVILGGDKHILVTGGSVTGEVRKSYGEIILSSRAILSHFGITLYEGFIASARLLALNPSDYHAHLTDLATDLAVINLGVRDSADPVMISNIIAQAVKNPPASSISAREVLNKINMGLENFTKLIFQLDK